MGLIIGIVIYIIAHYSAMFIAGIYIETCSSFENFIKSVQSTLYTIIITVALFWILFDKEAILFTTFATGYLITLARIDYEDVEEHFAK